jgi:transcriptional regulator with XRE-family HTH domain
MEQTNIEGFAGRLRLIRKTLKLKQREFAQRLKISGPALSEVENGKYKPGFDFIVDISREFNVNLYYLLFGEGEMFLDPTQSYTGRSRKFAVNIPDVRNFLNYFERSPYVQYSVLAFFRSLLRKDRETIEEEYREYKSPEEL